MDQDRFDVFVGLDVGKEHHHATALNTIVIASDPAQRMGHGPATRRCWPC